MGDKKPPHIDYLQILKEQFNALQTEHQDLRRKYDIECAGSATGSSSSSSFPSRLLNLTSSLLESDKFSDVVIHHPSSNTRIPAHRFLLAARTDNWNSELERESGNEVISLSADIDIGGFRRVIRWMYTDKMDMAGIVDGELLKVCEVASALKLKELSELCVHQLSARLSIENCVQIYEFAERQSLKQLSTVCGSMIAASWDQLGAAHFANMAAPLLYRLIDGNTKNVLHSIVSIGREDVLFLFFMQNSAKIPKILNEIDETEATALEKALTSDHEKARLIAEQLVEKGADLNAKDKKGDTILMRLVQKEDLPACNFLLKHGADPQACHSTHAYNLCHVAARSKSSTSRLATWLLEHKDQLDVNKVDAEERSPLIQSVLSNNHIVCEAFIRCGADLNIATSDGHTALSTCLLMSSAPNRRISELLIQNGANVNIRIIDNTTPLINELVSRGDVVGVEALLAAGVDVQCVDTRGRCALHVAASIGSPEVLNRIVETRRELQWLRDEDDKTPLDIAVEAKDLKSARICIRGGANVNGRDKNERCLLAKAILAQDDEMGVFLIEHDARAKDDDRISGKTFIEAACERSMLNSVRAFISNGCKLNARCSTGYSLIHSALSHQNLDVAALLVQFGCDLESRVTLNSEEVVPDGSEVWSVRQTLLHRLIDDGDQAGAVFLIERGADVNARKEYSNLGDDDKFTPAHMAISWAQNDVLRALRDKGADLCEVDVDGRTPAHIGVREQNVEGVEVLLAAETVDFIPIRDKFGQTVLSQSMTMKDHKIAALIVARQPHAAVQTNGNGENLLHQAIRQNDIESVLFLLAVAKADPTRPITDGSQKTPLHLAAVAKDEMILRNLILVNDDVNVKSSDGCTPLLEALKHRNDKHASILMENNADPNVKDEYGENAMLCAVRSGSVDCIRAVADSGRTHRHARNKIGYTSLHICALLTIDKLPKRATSTDVVELVLAYEEQYLQQLPQQQQEKHLAGFVDARDADGNTALMIAYSQGNAGVCRSLLKRRACMGQRNAGDVNVFTYETATKQLLLGLLESLESEPRWSDGDTCDCGSKFSLTSRKHHCRHCGRHVCSKCSETSMPIPKYGEEKRVRVCDVCAHVISTGTAPRRLNN